MWLCQCTKKRLSNFYSPSFLLLRQPDLPSTATPPPARASTMESLGFVLVFFGKDWCGYVNVPKKDCQISIVHHSFSLGSLIFHPLQHRPLQGTALWRFLDLLVAFFWENMMWVCQCIKKKCQISIAHHSFPLDSLILHPTLQRHKAEFRAPTPLDAHSTWDFNTYVCI